MNQNQTNNSRGSRALIVAACLAILLPGCVETETVVVKDCSLAYNITACKEEQAKQAQEDAIRQERLNREREEKEQARVDVATEFFSLGMVAYALSAVAGIGGAWGMKSRGLQDRVTMRLTMYAFAVAVAVSACVAWLSLTFRPSGETAGWVMGSSFVGSLLVTLLAARLFWRAWGAE